MKVQTRGNNIQLSTDLWARISLIVALLISFTGVLGLIINIPILKNFDPDLMHMRLITSVMLISCAVALLRYHLNPLQGGNRILLKLTGIIVSLVSGLTLYVFYIVFKTGNEHFLTEAPFFNLFLAHETRMALLTSVICLIFGLIMILFSSGNTQRINLAHILFIPAAVMSYFVLTCYLLGVHKYFEVDHVFVSLITGIAFLVQSMALLLMQPKTWLMKVLGGKSTGSIMARRLLPGLLVLPIIIGWMRIYGEQNGYYKSEIGVVMVAVTYMVSLLLLIWFAARSVNKTDESRKENEEARKKAEKQLAITLESIGDAVISTNSSGKISFMNPVAEKLTGWTLQEALDQPSSIIFNIINEYNREKVENPILKVLITGEILGLANHTILIRKDGTEVPIDDSAAPIRDKDGSLLGVVLVFRDISERKKAESLLLQSEARLRRSQQIGHLGGWELDIENNILTWSDEIYRIFGLQPQEFKATYEAFVEAVHPDDREQVDHAYNSSLKEGRDVYEIEHRVIRKYTGEVRYVHEKCTHIKNEEGKVIRSIGMVHDITERKIAEIALTESEERVRRKLRSILSPDEHTDELELEDIIDSNEIQSMMDYLYELITIPMAIIDNKGKVLVGVGWQEICTRFHRVNQETCKNCIQSDLQLTTGIPDGEFKLYKCANDMWDIATPLIIGGQPKGNLFMGQFFFDDERIDYDLFRRKAARYGFNEAEYINALDRAPKISKERLEYAKGFFLNLTSKISQLSYGNIKLARSIGERDRIHQVLLHSNERLDILSKMAGRLLASPDPQSNVGELCAKVMEHIDCQAFFNYIVDNEEGRLHLNAYAGIAESTKKSIEWLDFGVDICGCIAHSGERIVAENILQNPDPQTDLVRIFGIQAYCCHPLVGKDEVFGTLSFGTKTRSRFSDEDIAMMKVVADLVAIAINRTKSEKARIESETKAMQRAEELEKIMDVVPSAIWIARDPLCLEITGNAMANKFYEASEGENVSAGPGEPVQLRRFFDDGKELEASELPMQLAAATGREVRNSELEVLLPSGRWMTMLGNSIPLRDGEGNVRGCVGAFMDISERKKAENELRQLNRVLNALGKSSQVMLHSENEILYINEVCRILVEDCGHKMVWVGYALDDEAKSVKPVAHYGFEEGYLQSLNTTWSDTEWGRGPTGTAIKTGKPALCRNMFTDPSFEPWREQATTRGYASSIVLPLISEGKVFGAINIYSIDPDSYTPDEINLLTNLADDLAYGINTIRLKESENKALALLRESEEKYRLLFNEMIEGFSFHEIILDKEGKPCDYRFISVNPAFEKHTGLRADEVVGKKASEIYPSLEIYWLETYGEVALKGKSIEFENYNASLDRFFKISAFSPRKGYFATIFENITDRTLAEKELQSTKNYLESLINNANAPIIVWNPQSEIQLFNRAFEKLTGYTSSEVEGKNIDLLFPLSTLKETQRKIKQASVENWESLEISILTKDNNLRTVLWNSANIFDNDGKSLISVIAQGNDITERKKADQRLKEAREKLNLALDNGNIGTWEKDLKTNRLIWDKRMEKMFGFDEGAFDGNHATFERCLLEEDISHTREAIRRAVEEDTPYETVYRIKTGEGNVSYINAKALVIKDKKGKPVRMVGVCFDITGMKKGAERILIKLNDELLRSNKELEQFAYVASHDLQEPLRMVSSFTQLLEQRYKDKLDDDAREFIHYAVDGAARMQRLINDLLNYSRIGTKGQNFSNVDFNDIFIKAINNLKISIEEKKAEVTSDKLPFINADEMQMVQLLQNLIGNALKFCNQKPRIHISAIEDGNHYLFSVKDNGIGIEEQYFNRIFLIFQRLLPKDQYSGTGIGLAICKRIIERHGGKIWINSEVGKGTTFFFTLIKPELLN